MLKHLKNQQTDIIRETDKIIANKLVINPHTSYFSKESFIEMRKKAAANALRIVKNQIPLNVIK